MTAKKSPKRAETADVNPDFALVTGAFAKDRQVTRGDGKGFGSGTLKVKGRIFAMMSSKAKFVVKLPKGRVDELVGKGKGERFDPGHGRLMKEWLAVNAEKNTWVALAREACEFVKRSK
jgi:hypothetical protein